MIKKATIEYLNHGLSVLPASKVRKCPAIGAWKMYQQRLPLKAEVENWISSYNPDAVCIVTGKISGNLEIIDFDHQAILFDKWLKEVKEKLPQLTDKLVIQRTQSGGKHVIYRCQGPVDGNMKLASQTIDGKIETLIETRGEGGLFLCCPTQGYSLEQGSFDNIPVITEKQRSELIAIAAMFNEVKSPIDYKPTPRDAYEQFDDRPGDEFNARGNVGEILKLHGWQFVGQDQVNQHWRRPDKTQGGLSATLRKSNNTFYVFSSNAYPFEGSKAYSPFAVYTLLEHNGDFAEAASKLSSDGL